MRVTPNPRVMPCTKPNPSATAATPASAPLSTGSNPRISSRGERYANNRRAATMTVARSEKRVASRSIVARVRTAKTPGPVSRRLRCLGAGHLVLRAIEGRLDLRQPLLLGVDVEAGGAGLDQQQRATLVLGEPDAVPGVGPRGAGELLDQGQDLAGGIVGQAALHQRGKIGAEEMQVVLEGGAQPRRGEALGLHARAQQIAVAPEHVALRREGGVLAVVDGGKLGLRPQAPGHRLAERGEGLRRRTLDPQQDQARDHAVADLVHQHLLRGGRRARQERAHVRADAAARDEANRDRHRDQPDSDRDNAAAGHRTSSTMLISEMSPSPSSVTTVETLLPAPAMRIDLRNFCSFGSVGCSSRCQSMALPSSCTA